MAMSEIKRGEAEALVREYLAIWREWFSYQEAVPHEDL